MRRIAIALMLITCIVAASWPAGAHAQGNGGGGQGAGGAGGGGQQGQGQQGQASGGGGGFQDPQCQMLFRQLADPVMSQMLWYTQAANAFPITPWARPVISPWPYYGYPGFGPIFAGPGGPSWQFATGSVPLGLAAVASTNPVATPFVVNQIAANTPGGLTGLQTSDLLSLAQLRQAVIGNVLAAGDARQAIIGNRLAAADLNATMTGYPLERASNLSDVLAGIQTYVSSVCPMATGQGS